MKKLAQRHLPSFIVFLVIGLIIAAGVWLIWHSFKNSIQQVIDTSNLSTTDPDLRIFDMVKDLNNPVAVVFPTQTAVVYGVASGEVRGRILANNEDWPIFTPSGLRTSDGFGLLSLLADREFSDNRYIYSCYPSSSDIRLTRYKLSNDLKSVLETKDILTGIEVKSVSNVACALAMDVSGQLWIGTGDSEIPSASQSPSSLAGKILRINRDGQAVAGNLTSPFDTRIFSYGHRKVTSIVLIDRLLDNLSYGYSIDQGGSADELNYLKAGNFGHNPASGSSYNPSASMTDKGAYPEAIEAVWSSSGGSIGMQSAVFIRNDRWQAWQNRLLVTTPIKSEAKLFEFDENGAYKSDKSVLTGRARSFNNLINAPDNTIYGTKEAGTFDDIIQIKVVCTVCG